MIPLIVIVVVVGFLIWLYNGLVGLRNQMRSAWAQIDVQLKRRHDLIPNLVSAVQGYLQHEKDVLERVTAARTRAISAKGPAEAGAAEGALTQAVSGLIAVVERYPDLKASQNVLALQEELVSTENRIGFARQLYNDLVARYNTRRESFPMNVVAASLGFQSADLFQTEAADREVPKVELGPR